MGKRVRPDGTILCSAMHPPSPGDLYVDDRESYLLAVVWRVIVAEPMEQHRHDGLWWWFDDVPADRQIEVFDHA